MKRIAWIVAVALVIGLLGWGARHVYRSYAMNWFRAFMTSYEEGDDATARTFAERLRWISNQESARLLAELDVTHAIGLSGAERRKALERARKSLDTAFPDNDAHPSQDVEFQKAFLEAELGHVADAMTRVRHVCKITQNALVSFHQCMQSITPTGTYVDRENALKDYENATLAQKLGMGDPVLMRFQVANAMQRFDLDRARDMREDMIREGVYTKRMEAMYCEVAVNMCTDYTAK